MKYLSPARLLVAADGTSEGMYTKYRVGENTRGLSGTLTATAIILGVAVIRASTARAIVDVA